MGAAQKLPEPQQTPRWLVYSEAARHVGLSVRTLRNLVSARQIPVYGRPHHRRFLRTMLDLWVKDHALAMRTWEEEKRSGSR